MKKEFFLFFIFCMSLYASVLIPADMQVGQQLSEKDYHEYLLYLADAGDKKQMDFILQEMRNYLSFFPDGLFAEDVQFKMGVLFEKLGAPLEAFCAYLKALHLYPGSPRKAEIIEDLGRLCDGRSPARNFKKSLPELLRLSEKKDTSEDRFEHYLGLLRELDKMVQENALAEWRIRECREFLFTYPGAFSCPEISMQLASLYEGQKMYTEAFYILMKMNYLYPDAAVLPKSLLKLGKMSLERFDRPDRAIEFFTRVTLHYPKTTHSAEAMLLLGRVYADEMKDFDKAIASYDKLAEDFAGSPMAGEGLYEKALLLVEKTKQYPEALSVYLKIHTDYPDQNIAKIALVNGAELAEEKIADMKTAVRLYRMLTAEYPAEESAPDWLYHGGVLAEEALADVTLATSIYNQVLDKYPDSKAASKAKKNLEKLAGSSH